MSKVIVLNSGGFDSVVLMNEVAQEGKEIISLFFDYGQRNRDEERRCCYKVSDKLGAEVVEVTLPHFKWSHSALTDPNISSDAVGQYMPMRNMVFLSYALSLAESKAVKEIYCAFIKAENGNYYPDTSPTFVESMNKVAERIGVRIIAPYIEYEKELLINACRVHNITREDFFSCNTPNVIDGEVLPCHQCGDCTEVDYLFENYVDPNRVTDLFINNDFKVSHEFIEEYRKEGKINFAKLFINNDCQFRCKHCLYGFQYMRGEKLSVKETEKVISQLVNLGVTTIDFGGKEPLYDETVFEYMKFINKKFPQVGYSLITNGVNIEKYLKELDKYKPQISLSVESLNDLTFRPTNKTILNSINLLKGIKLIPEISIDMHKDNVKDIPFLVSELYTLGINTIYIKPIIPLGLNAENVIDKQVSPEDIMQVIKEINYSRLYDNVDICMDLCMSTVHQMRHNKEFMDYIEFYKKSRVNYIGNVRMELEFYCNRFLGKVSITPDGYVLGCGQELASPHYESLALGNVKDEPIEDILIRGLNQASNLSKRSDVIGCYFCANTCERGCILK